MLRIYTRCQFTDAQAFFYLPLVYWNLKVQMT